MAWLLGFGFPVWVWAIIIACAGWIVAFARFWAVIGCLCSGAVCVVLFGFGLFLVRGFCFCCAGCGFRLCPLFRLVLVNFAFGIVGLVVCGFIAVGFGGLWVVASVVFVGVVRCVCGWF